ncbi:GH3 auxin-responsive promoter family protein [Falsiporphyromonas endometrii]|uniref:GH3 auxin-responsive promoter family protein n=1 Tax=Falsiporphyromonas endometrii TaxID=1387297 RepID=A0ABV9K9M5_9PORP
MDIKTRLVYTFMKSRIRAIEKSFEEPMETQETQLRLILNEVGKTIYARKFGLDNNCSIRTFQDRCPINDYESLSSYIIDMMQGQKNVLVPGRCDWFAQSSGTTSSRSKYLPVPRKHLQQCHFRGGSDTLWIYLNNRPDSHFFNTKGLVLGGSFKPVNIGLTAKAGDLSSILIEKMPRLGNCIRVPHKKVLLMNEWETKMEAIVQEVKDANVGSLSGVPSWMLVMIKKVLATKGCENLSEVWPNLEVFFHGGINFDPYREIYKELIPSQRMQYMETFNASEGFFGIQDDPSISSMRLMLDYGVFYEFIPFDEVDSEQPSTLTLDKVSLHTPYAMVISTLGGLYRYKIGDLVSFDSLNPYRIKICGRTKCYINAFGEELMVDNAEKAITEVSKLFDTSIIEYTAAPLLMKEKGKGRHEWLIEFDSDMLDKATLHLLESKLDEKLRELNSDYDAKRYKDMTLLPLKITQLPRGTFHQWLERRGKLGGQHKVPRLSNTRNYYDSILKSYQELTQK